MSISKVISPVGESIEIVTDKDWMELTGCTQKGLNAWYMGSKRFTITELFWHGEVADAQTGRAGRILWERMAASFGADNIQTQPSSFSGLMKDRTNAPAFAVVRNAKRTYSIKLVALPMTWYKKVIGMMDDYDTEPIPPEPVEEPAAAVEEPPVPEPTADLITPAELAGVAVDEFEEMMRGINLDAPTVYDMPPPLDISIASQVAMSLLTTVVEIISAGSGAAVDEKVRRLQGDLNDVMTKLSSRLEENDRFRRQLRQAGDEINALRHERDGLRSRLRATEANLTAALKGDAVQAINGEIQKRVDAIMRVSPKGKGDDE